MKVVYPITITQPDLTYLGSGEVFVESNASYEATDSLGNTYTIHIADDGNSYKVPGVESNEGFFALFQENYRDWQCNSVDPSKWYWGSFAFDHATRIDSFQFVSTQPNYLPQNIRIYGDSTLIAEGNISTFLDPNNIVLTVTKPDFYNEYRIECQPNNATAFILSKLHFTGLMQLDYDVYREGFPVLSIPEVTNA